MTRLVTVEPDASGVIVAWVSWNGATDVAEWVLLAGSAGESLDSVDRVPRDGFEGALPVPEGAERIAVRAIDRRGRTLGTSRSIRVAAALAEPRTVA